jgi:Fur family transcriptional regulator, zinc uptake regulator
MTGKCESGSVLNSVKAREGGTGLEFHDTLTGLKERGIKLTPQRIEILRALAAAGRPLAAQEVLTAVRKALPHISLDTIYRNLTMLTQDGLTNQVNLQVKESARFELQGPQQHHHHLVCLGCGRSFCVEACPLPIEIASSEDPSFRIVSHAFEIYGYCSECQAKEEDEDGR